jgi:hypothetical protein
MAIIMMAIVTMRTFWVIRFIGFLPEASVYIRTKNVHKYGAKAKAKYDNRGKEWLHGQQSLVIVVALC